MNISVILDRHSCIKCLCNCKVGRSARIRLRTKSSNAIVVQLILAVKHFYFTDRFDLQCQIQNCQSDQDQQYFCHDNKLFCTDSTHRIQFLVQLK